MKVLDRYISQEFLKAFVFGVLTLILVSTVVDVFERIDDIVQFKPPMTVTITYFCARVPQLLILTTPIAVLLTTLLVLGGFARNSEIIAMLASGVSIYRILLPLLVIGLGISLIVFALNEFVVPTTNRIEEETRLIIKGKPDRRKMAKIQIWYRGTQENRIYYIDALIPEKKQAHLMTVFQLNDDFLPVQRMDAEQAYYRPLQTPEKEANVQEQRSAFTRLKDELATISKKLTGVLQGADNDNGTSQPTGMWVLFKGSLRSFTNDKDRSITTFRRRRDTEIRQSFDEFRRDTQQPEDMNYRELKTYIETLTASGAADVSKYLVDLRAKFSYPFVSLVMVIIGFPFALKSPRSGAAFGVGLSVFIGLTYWILLQLGIALGHAQIFPPGLAAWIPNIMFACAGWYLIFSTRT